MSGADAKSVRVIGAYFTGIARSQALGVRAARTARRNALVGLLNSAAAAHGHDTVRAAVSRHPEYPGIGLYARRQMQGRLPPTDAVPEHGRVGIIGPGREGRPQSEDGGSGARPHAPRSVLSSDGFAFVRPVGGEDPGAAEVFRPAGTWEEFAQRLRNPEALAGQVGTPLWEFLARTLAPPEPAADPAGAARLVSSYARDLLARIEAAANAPALGAIRTAFDGTLGLRIKGPGNIRHFHVTLARTLLHGILASWLLRPERRPGEPFDWRGGVRNLGIPVLEAIFRQLCDGNRPLRPLDLAQPLDWAAAALDRADGWNPDDPDEAAAGIAPFTETLHGHLVPNRDGRPFRPSTPPGTGPHMAERVDSALRGDLDMPAGLADGQVHVLDPCCGSGALLAEALRRAASAPGTPGTAIRRIWGFEIDPAAHVLAHLRLRLTLRALGMPPAGTGEGQVRVFLANALTGWDARREPHLPFIRELEDERAQAERVKREAPILAVLGHPPATGLPGMAADEEPSLARAYVPEGERRRSGTFVRFLRIAERRITETTGRGVVCIVSDGSWLGDGSLTDMRGHLLRSFDSVRIDRIGDGRGEGGAGDGTGRDAPTATGGTPSHGAVIATLVRKDSHAPAGTIGFRSVGGPGADSEPPYRHLPPLPAFGLPFLPVATSERWFDWPTLPDLFPVFFTGMTVARRAFLLDTDLDRLRARVSEYLDPTLDHDEIARRHPAIMRRGRRFDGRAVREKLVARGAEREDGFVLHTHRPFDNRWLYWEADGLLTDPRPDYRSHAFEGNLWIEAREGDPTRRFSRGTFVRFLADGFGDGASSFFPARLRQGGGGLRPNLSLAARDYLDRLELGIDDLFHFVLATLHDPDWRTANADGLRSEWPRIPLPGWPDGTGGAAASLMLTAARGRQLVGLMDPDAPVYGITGGSLLPGVEDIAVAERIGGDGPLAGNELAVDAGWGYAGANGNVLPGRGRAVRRTGADGADILDIHLNARALWRNVPADVWDYELGGHKVLRAWLTHRERRILGRPLTPRELRHFTDTARRIAAILHPDRFSAP